MWLQKKSKHCLILETVYLRLKKRSYICNSEGIHKASVLAFRINEKYLVMVQTLSQLVSPLIDRRKKKFRIHPGLLLKLLSDVTIFGIDPVYFLQLWRRKYGSRTEIKITLIIVIIIIIIII